MTKDKFKLLMAYCDKVGPIRGVVTRGGRGLSGEAVFHKNGGEYLISSNCVPGGSNQERLHPGDFRTRYGWFLLQHWADDGVTHTDLRDVEFYCFPFEMNE